MRFLFRLDLSLHAGAENFFWNFEFRNQTRPRFWSKCCLVGEKLLVLELIYI